jgi:hypothetical protein
MECADGHNRPGHTIPGSIRGLLSTEIHSRCHPAQRGHADNAGCFRCNDENSVAPATEAAARKTIAQDCSACHQALAVEETVNI